MKISTLLKIACYSLVLLFFLSCKEDKKVNVSAETPINKGQISFAKGFTIEKMVDGVTVLKVTSPWSNADTSFTYALVPKEKSGSVSLNKAIYDAIIATPVEHIIVTSTTHIPALEALGVEEKLVGFPDTQYVSSKKTRLRIDQGLVKEIGSNQTINTEMVIATKPDLIIAFSIDNKNASYETLQRSNIPVVYNGDWTEETPLGKAEWIKFFAPFFDKEAEADRIFTKIETTYSQVKSLAKTATSTPTVMSGAIYKDVWYLPGGKSWGAQFINDANANYLWKETEETGSLSLSWEVVLEKSKYADFWIGPAQFTSYTQMNEASKHYGQFNAFKNKKVHTFSKAKGATGGLLYYELAPQRPDLVLKDLIHIFHPELLPNHQTIFFKPLD